MKTLLISILLTCGILPLYANGIFLPQDSVKKVSVRIIVSEKPRAMNFDSLLESRQPVKMVVAKRDRSTNQNQASSNKGTSKFQTSTKGSIKKSTPVRKAARKGVSQKGQKQKSISYQEGQHKEELTETQVAGDNTSDELHVAKTSRTYLWVGFMLMVVGVILGILFGKTALLISIAGMIFVIIGYTI